MLDEHFYIYLEWQLSEAFARSDDVSIKPFWCDGILPPTSEYMLSPKSVNDTRKIQLRAFIGKDGQREYDLILNFGTKSLSRYARGLEIESCVPDPEESDWYQLDVSNKTVVIQLL